MSGSEPVRIVDTQAEQEKRVRSGLDSLDSPRSVRACVPLGSSEEADPIAKRIEQCVRERTAYLEAKIHDLEGFTYSVSHDLRSPIRSILANSRILQEDFGSILPDEAQAILSRQAEACTRLSTIIDELLKLSRISREKVVLRDVDMTQLAQETAQEVAGNAPVSVCVEPGMSARADAQLMRFVFQNLIENAVKFSPNGGEIRVGSTQHSDRRVFFVKDEGIGFEMQYEPKLWLPFERLVLDSQFPGTGIGLANVKRIVERHGGHTWAEGAPGRGATFFFMI